MEDTRRKSEKPCPYASWTIRADETWDLTPDREIAEGDAVFHVKRVLTMAGYNVLDADTASGGFGIGVGPATELMTDDAVAITFHVGDPTRLAAVGDRADCYSLAQRHATAHTRDAVVALLRSDEQGFEDVETHEGGVVLAHLKTRPHG